MNFFCFFSMFFIIPVVSLIHNAIKYNVYFASDNIMRPWNFTYCLQNLILIFTYFFGTTDFITSVRENILIRDVDIWEKHVNQIVHYIKQPDEAEEDPTIEVEVL